MNIANRTRGDTNENWAFNNLLKTPKGKPKTFDIAVAIAVRTLGLEDPNYWQYLYDLEAEYRKNEFDFDIDAMPHEDTFLNICCFFIVAFSQLETNHFRVTLQALPNNKYWNCHSWGHDHSRCQKIWDVATRIGR